MDNICPIKITWEDAALQEGYPDLVRFIEDMRWASIVPACCSFGCQVEPDGTCEHGYPSVLIELDLI